VVRPGPDRKTVAEVAGGGIDPLPVGIQAPEHVDPVAAAGGRGAFPVKGREGGASVRRDVRVARTLGRVKVWGREGRRL